MSKPQHSLKGRTAVALLIAAVAALVAVAPGVAAKGGNKGSNSTQSTGAWVSATPNPASVGDRIYLQGCGYEFQVATVSVTRPDGSTESFLVGMWANGCTDTASFFADQAGTYTVRVSTGNVSGSTSVNVA